MRILQVYHIYPAIFGGVSRVVCDITRELCKRGHEVSVLTTDLYFSNTNAIEIENNNGVEIYRVPTFLKMFARTNNIALPQPSLIYLVKNNIKNFDVIHFHGHRSFQKVVVHHYARKYHIPYIIQAHGDLPKIMAKRRSKQVYDVLFGYRLLRDASKVIALSRVEAEQYRGMGVPEEKIEVIPNGIDLSEYGDLPPKGSFKKKFGIDEDEKIVLYLGRIHKIKGIDILVRAFANVVEKLGDVKFVVVGPDDGYLGELEALIKALKIKDNVLILGPLYGRDKLEAYVDADVYVLPSRYEVFGMTILEACACAKPVVATKVSGAALDIIINGHTGFLVQPENVLELAEALRHLLTNEDRARKMGMQAQERVVKMISIETSVDKIENLYKKLYAKA